MPITAVRAYPRVDGTNKLSYNKQETHSSGSVQQHMAVGSAGNFRETRNNSCQRQQLLLQCCYYSWCWLLLLPAVPSLVGPLLLRMRLPQHHWPWHTRGTAVPVISGTWYKKLDSKQREHLRADEVKALVQVDVPRYPEM